MDSTSPALLLGAALAAGLMIGIERGWRLRRYPAGTRVAGVRTFALVGAGGGIAALLGTMIHPGATLVLAVALLAGLGTGYWRDRAQH
ncbi:MAG TPA: MgtC/SapB family protein, partial [Sphingomicrobium sp.]|nr:MgtC/SapB family protein [Sphingomicrobium sp.]